MDETNPLPTNPLQKMSQSKMPQSKMSQLEARLDELEVGLQAMNQWAQGAHESILDLEETSDAAASYDMVAELGSLQGLGYTEPVIDGEEDPEGEPYFSLTEKQIEDGGRGTHWLPTEELLAAHAAAAKNATTFDESAVGK